MVRSVNVKILYAKELCLCVASCKQYLADWNVWSENKTLEYNQLLEVNYFYTFLLDFTINTVSSLSLALEDYKSV